MSRRARAALALATLAGASCAAGAASGAATAEGGRSPSPADAVTAAAVPAEVHIGGAVAVSGRVAGEGLLDGRSLTLAAEPLTPVSPAGGPYRPLASVATLADGTFAFARLRPSRDLNLRVLEAGGARSAVLTVIVDPIVSLRSRSLGPGRVLLSLRIVHAALGGPPAVRAHWLIAAAGSRSFTQVAVTAAREVAPGVTRASAIVAPPSPRFAIRVCLRAPWTGVMATRVAHVSCAAGGAASALAFSAEGRGTPLAPYPPPAAAAAAARFLQARAGRTAFAVIDSAGHAAGVRLHEHFQTASVVKVMMLIAYLRRLAAAGRPLDPLDTGLLYPMIHVSDNAAASAVLAIVGPGSLALIAREVGMTDYAPGVGWWAFTQTSALDQARLMFALPSLVPQRFYGYARHLLSTIEPAQSWGVPAVARPGWQVFFKTGALPSRGLFNEVARLERGPVAFSVAVLTEADPSMGYGEETIAGVASRLLVGSSP